MPDYDNMPLRPHPVKRVHLHGIGEEDVDVKMIDAVKALNVLGFRTTKCCQGDRSYDRYIEFDMASVDVEVDEDDGDHGTIRIKILHWGIED